MKIKKLAWIIIASLLCLTASPALCGTDIRGALFIAEGNPGDYVDHSMTIGIDDTDSPKNFSVQLMGFGQSLSGASSPLKPEEDISPYSARPFLEINLTEFHLDSGGSQTVNMTGRIPDDVGEGGRYAIVTISSLSPGGEGSVGISVGFEVPVLLTIDGTELIHTGEITDVEIDEIESSPGIKVSAIFKNTGNHHYKAKAGAVLQDKSGKVLAEASTPLSFSSIIPPNSREFKLSLEPGAELNPGAYNLNVTISLKDGTVLANKEIPFEKSVSGSDGA
jgi:hypothetical protein